MTPINTIGTIEFALSLTLINDGYLYIEEQKGTSRL